MRVVERGPGNRDRGGVATAGDPGGVGGEPGTRDRAAEFAAREGGGAGELLARLDQVLDDCDRVLAALDRSLEAEGEAALARRIVVQGFDQTVLDALFHAVEHMSYHTGQIVHIARRHGSAPIRFYDDRALGELP